MTISQETLATLPQDGVPHNIPEMEDEVDVDLDGPGGVDNGGGDAGNDEDAEGATTVTAVNMQRPQLTEAEHIANALGTGTGTNLQWPRRGEQPVNEYSQVGMFTQAFPTLFPEAAADITHVDPERPRRKKLTSASD